MVEGCFGSGQNSLWLGGDHLSNMSVGQGSDEPSRQPQVEPTEWDYSRNGSRGRSPPCRTGFQFMGSLQVERFDAHGDHEPGFEDEDDGR